MSDLDKLIEAVEGGICPSIIVLGAALPFVNVMGAFNGSLDAAKALHEAITPEFLVQELQQNSLSMGWNMLLVTDGGDYISSHAGGNVGYLSCPARAWLLAILKAYRSQCPERS